MVPLLDMLGPRVVGDILRKVDGTLVITMESEFVLPNSQLSNELLHPEYFLASFHCGHILGFRGPQCLDFHETTPT